MIFCVISDFWSLYKLKALKKVAYPFSCVLPTNRQKLAKCVFFFFCGCVLGVCPSCLYPSLVHLALV